MKLSEKIERAHNTNTSPEVLILLAQDKGAYVRYYVAQNTSTPAEVLSLLAKDEDIYVREAAKQNKNYVERDIYALFEQAMNN